jgi:riboflavin kinase/FMN adenylyltransferase
LLKNLKIILILQKKMQVFKNYSDFNIQDQTVLTIGTFDGVHLGHQNLLQNMVKYSKKENLKSLVLTFFPTPAQYFRKSIIKNQLNSISEKIQLIENQNIDFLIVQPFDEKFANLDAETFVKEVLINQLKIKKIIVGYDHRFGKNRSAGYEELVDYGRKFNFDVAIIEAFSKNEIIISSSKIREFLQYGDVENANKLLGKPFFLQGKIIHGNKIGASLGFPTANIEVKDNQKIIPKIGVYFVKISINNVNFYGMMNIGYNPTFNNEQLSLEVHIFNYNTQIYNKNISICFIKRIRDEQKFNSKMELVKQLEKDKEFCYSLLI